MNYAGAVAEWQAESVRMLINMNIHLRMNTLIIRR